MAITGKIHVRIAFALAALLLALPMVFSQLTYAPITYYENGADTTITADNFFDSVYSTSTLRTTSGCSVAANVERYCFSAVLRSDLIDECIQNGTECDGGMMISDFDYTGYFAGQSANRGYLNINVTMVDGAGAQTLICRSASDRSGVFITSTSYLPYSIHCTPASPVFVPSGYQIRVYMNVYGTQQTRTYTHRFNNVAANGTLTLTAARLAAINVSLTQPAADTSIPLSLTDTATCLVNGMTGGQQAASVNVTLLESYNNVTYFPMSISGQNITTSSTNPTANADLSANTNYDFTLLGANPSVNNYLKCNIHSIYNQSYNCSAAACAVTGIDLLSPLPARRINVTFNATLLVWDNNDTLGGGQTIYPGDDAIFYADFSYLNGSPISTGACNITYHDATTDTMSYNSSSGTFEATRTYSSQGAFAYNVTCALGSSRMSANSTINIASAQINLLVWDSNNTEGGGFTIYPSDTARFYANLTFQNGSAVSGGTCNITYHDSTFSTLVYNATSKLFASNRTYSSPGTFAYNVSCSYSGSSANASSSIQIASYVLNLSIWDSNKTTGGGFTIYPSDTARFYANLTFQNGSTVAAGACNITYHDGAFSTMSYNSTSRLFNSNRSYNSSGNFAYNVSCGYSTSSVNSNSSIQIAAYAPNLTIWDSNKSAGGGFTIYPGDMARFYSNYTFSNGTPVSGGACNITYQDGAFSTMSYNATSLLFTSSRTFNSSGNFTYNVSCNYLGAIMNASTFIQIAAYAPNLTIWDSNKSAGGGFTIYPGDMARFYSNFTFQNGSAVTGGTCNITYQDGAFSAMAYNNTSFLFTSSRTYNSSGNFTYNVSCNYSGVIRNASTFILIANSTYNLTIWDSNKTAGGGFTIYPGNMSYFYANYTYQNLSPVAGGTCNIVYHDSTSALMAYNATSKLFNANRTYNSSGNFTYNVSCNSSSVFVNRNSTIQIAPLILALSVWDSTKPAGGSQQIAPGNTSYFFANFTSQFGIVNTGMGGSCNITYYDNTSAIMTYNASNGVYYSSRAMPLPGTFIYNITCFVYLQNVSNSSTITVIPLVCNSQPRPKSDYPAGLVSYWSLDKNTTDNYGANNGLAYGAALACGKVSGGYGYYTRADRIVVPYSASLSLPENGTYEILIFQRTFQPSAGFMHKGQLSSFTDEDISFQLVNYSNIFQTIFHDTLSNTYSDIGTSVLPTGSWTHMVLSWDSVNSWIYYNGALEMLSSKPGLVRDSGGALVIGAQLNQSFDPIFQMFGIDGIADEVAVYSKSMNLTTAQEHYNNTLKSFNYFPLKPNITFNGSMLFGTATFIDPDADTLNYSYRWYKNGIAYSSGNSTPYNYPQGVLMDISNQTNISHGENWTLEVWATDGKAASNPINSTPYYVDLTHPINLSVFSSTDPQGGNLTIYEGVQAQFYANVTLQPNNTSVSVAACNITYHDGMNYSMAYNNSSGMYTQNRSYNFTGNYTYHVACAYGATDVNATGNVLISAVMFVSTNQSSYKSCGTVFYTATTVTPLSMPVDTELNVSVKDPFNLQMQFDPFAAGNDGKGIYIGDYNITSSDPSGLWKIRANTCGAIAQSTFNVN